MRFARIRRMLGPLEPPLRRTYAAVLPQVARIRRRGLVVVATAADHDDHARALAEGLGPRLVGVWVCCRSDIADLGSHGWFVVRLDPSSMREPDRRQAEVAAIVASWRRACRQVDVIDLDAD